jgi:hypothetical protein
MVGKKRQSQEERNFAVLAQEKRPGGGRTVWMARDLTRKEAEKVKKDVEVDGGYPPGSTAQISRR